MPSVIVGLLFTLKGYPKTAQATMYCLACSNYMFLGMTSGCLPVLQLIALMACNNAASSLLMRCLAEATTLVSPVVQLFMARRALVLMHCSAQCLCHAWPAGLFVALKTAWGQLRQLIAGALASTASECRCHLCCSSSP